MTLTLTLDSLLMQAKQAIVVPTASTPSGRRRWIVSLGSGAPGHDPRPYSAHDVQRSRSSLKAVDQDHEPVVVLAGVRDEFRTALRQEIEAARRNASSGAVPLVNGRQIAQVGAGFQYVFDVENALNVPGDAPGDLLVTGRAPIEVIVISVEGLAITISVPVDLGGFVPSARLQSNLTQLMRKLITRIEDWGDKPNPAGDRIRGAEKVGGNPAHVEIDGLNVGQAAAVASVLGRDTTFIWGPPGTGKTLTIGAIGSALFARGRSMLMASHTNAAVDQALLKIADALRLSAPEAIKAGKVLRVGDPVDQRFRDHPDLLLDFHVARRAADLAARREVCASERSALVADVIAVGRTIAIAEWVAEALRDLASMQTDLSEVARIELEIESARTDLRSLTANENHWQRAGEAARQSGDQRRRLGGLRGRLTDLRERMVELRDEVARASSAFNDASALLAEATKLAPDRAKAQRLPSVAEQVVAAEATRQAATAAAGAHIELSARLTSAESLMAESTSVNGLTRRWRRLPSPEEQSAVVADLRARTEAAAGSQQLAEANRLSASALLEEVTELATRLAPCVQVPDLDTQRHAVIEAERARRRASDRLDVAQTGITAAETVIATLTTAIADFDADYGASPEAVLDQSVEHAAALAESRTRVDRLTRLAGGRRDALEDLLSTRLSVLREWKLTAARSTSAETMLTAITDAHRAAQLEIAGTDLASLRTRQAGLNNRIRELDAEIAEIDDQLAKVEELVIADAMVLATTLTRTYLRDPIQARRFDTVVIDEASMAPIPALWIAASLADRCIVAVGDFKQLPPIVISTAPEAVHWLGTDVFAEAGMTDHRTAPEHFVTLTEQFRMHPKISAIPNEMIYDHLLTDGAGTDSDAALDTWYRRDWGSDSPVLLVDTGSIGAWVTSVSRGNRSSRLNFLSATVCVDLAEQLLHESRPDLRPGAPPRILIACPYRPHAQLLELLLRENDLTGEVRAGTAHTFQGSEADVVILDLVNDEPHWKVALFTPGRDESTRRMLNVALTRARRRLIVVGDFDYIAKNAKRAFLGAELLPFLRSSYPVVDAKDIVPAGLAARAAKGQTAVLGGDVEPVASRLVVTQEHFFSMLSGDLSRARRRVVIYSPFVTANRVAQLEPQLRAAIERNVAVYVVTKALGDRGARDQSTYRSLERALTDWGVVVVHKRNMHEKVVFIDDDLLWSGSLNPLSFSDTQEIMERRRSRVVVDDYSRAIRLEDLVGEYDSATPSCPICGAEILASEGKDEPFYWRCVEDGCYSRSIDQPRLTDGVITCANCAAPVEWGTWGDEPAWRCVANRHHHQRVARTHLRLPKMRALIPARDLRKADKDSGVDASFRPGAEPSS